MANNIAKNQMLLCQIDLENTYSNKNTMKYMRELIGENNEIEVLGANLRNSLMSWKSDPEIESELDTVVPALLDIDITNAIYNAIAYIMIRNGKRCTIQEVIGAQLGNFSHLEVMHFKLYAATFIVSAASQFKFINESVRKGYQTLLWSTFTFNDEVMNHINTQGYVLPSIIPLKEIKNNSMSGYQTFEKSVILGGKHHKEFVCLSHINKVNSTPYQYENRLRQLVEPVFKDEREVKKDGKWETDEDIEKRRETFKRLHTNLPERIDAVQFVSNTFFLAHGYCTRGRTHVNANEYNYQGSKFLKGMIDLADQELIDPEW